MKIILTIILLTGMSIALSCQVPKKAETVSVNGKNIYYEVYGEGEPLILLHGYTLSSHHWKPYVQDYNSEYEVYLVDLTGHGKSDPFTETLSIRSVAEDLNALFEYLNLQKVKAIGFSFGGDILYQLALINPDVIDRMITIGAVGIWSIADFPEYLEIFTFENRDNFPWLKESHVSDSQVKAIIDQFENYKVELSDEELQSIEPEVMIMFGDDDEGMKLSDIVRVREHLPDSDLWILPGVSHSAHEGETKDEFIKKSKLFLSKE